MIKCDYCKFEVKSVKTFTGLNRYCDICFHLHMNAYEESCNINDDMGLKITLQIICYIGNLLLKKE